MIAPTGKAGLHPKDTDTLIFGDSVCVCCNEINMIGEEFAVE